MDSNLCQDDYHVNTILMYCSDCKVLVCSKCLKNHPKHLLDEIDDKIESCIDSSSQLVEKVKEYIEKKEFSKSLHVQSFKEDVEDVYQLEVTGITNVFRELHDLLHFKEVELKRELKSYYDENVENNIIELSKLDHEIDQHKQFITINNNGTTKTFNNLTDKINFIRSTDSITKEIKDISTNNNNNNNNNNSSTITNNQQLYPKYKVTFRKETKESYFKLDIENVLNTVKVQMIHPIPNLNLLFQTIKRNDSSDSLNSNSDSDLELEDKDREIDTASIHSDSDLEPLEEEESNRENEIKKENEIKHTQLINYLNSLKELKYGKSRDFIYLFSGTLNLFLRKVELSSGKVSECPIESKLIVHPSPPANINSLIVVDNLGVYQFCNGHDIYLYATIGNVYQLKKIVVDVNLDQISAVYDGKQYIYLIGGYELFQTYRKTVYRFDIITNKTSYVGDTCGEVTLASCVYYNDFIYIIGGGPLHYCIIERFDVRTSISTKLLSNSTYGGFLCSVHDPSEDSIYILTGIGKFLQYQISANLLIKLKSIPFGPLSGSELVLGPNKSICLIVQDKDQKQHLMTYHNNSWKSKKLDFPSHTKVLMAK